jgi:hypothetical protein
MYLKQNFQDILVRELRKSTVFSFEARSIADTALPLAQYSLNYFALIE